MGFLESLNLFELKRLCEYGLIQRISVPDDRENAPFRNDQNADHQQRRTDRNPFPGV
jgi:hypothetical protein